MKISELLRKEAMQSELQAQTKVEALKELVEILKGHQAEIRIGTVLEVLLDREKLGSTGIGDGVAIPHGKLGNLDRILVSFGRSTQGIPFDSLDEKPVHLFFLLVAPENSTGSHLKALARISRLLKNPDFRQRLMEAKGVDELYRTVIEEDERYE